MPIPSYAHNFAVPPLIGGVCIEVPTYEEDGYDLRIEEFEKRVTPRTRIVIITNPNNPTATVYKRETLERLAGFVKRHNLIMVVDQAFEDTAFDGHEMVNIAALPGMQERTILLGSLSKGMALCGFRVAYVVAPDAISRMLQSCAVLFLGAPNTMAQAGAVAALKDSAFVEDTGRSIWPAPKFWAKFFPPYRISPSESRRAASFSGSIPRGTAQTRRLWLTLQRKRTCL